LILKFAGCHLNFFVWILTLWWQCFWKFWKHFFWSVNWKKKLLKFWKKLPNFQNNNFKKKNLVTSSVLFWVNFHCAETKKIRCEVCKVFGKSCGFLQVDPCPKWHGFLSTMLGDLCDPVSTFIICRLRPQLGWNLVKFPKLSLIHHQCTHDQRLSQCWYR